MKIITVILIVLIVVLILSKKVYLKFFDPRDEEYKITRTPLLVALISIIMANDIFDFQIIPFWNIELIEENNEGDK